jgi:hypothetical protein
MARPEKPRARSRGGARACTGTGTGTGTRPSGAQAGQQASQFMLFSKPWVPGTSGSGSRSRLGFSADKEVV